MMKDSVQWALYSHELQNFAKACPISVSGKNVFWPKLSPQSHILGYDVKE